MPSMIFGSLSILSHPLEGPDAEQLEPGRKYQKGASAEHESAVSRLAFVDDDLVGIVEGAEDPCQFIEVGA